MRADRHDEADSSFSQLCKMGLNILIGAIAMCFHLHIVRVSSVKTQLVYCQL